MTATRSDAAAPLGRPDTLDVIDGRLRTDLSGLRLPVVAAPMYTVTGPELVQAACLAGIAGVLPALNAPDLATLDGWLGEIQHARGTHADTAGPLAVNLPATMDSDAAAAVVATARRHDIDLFITVGGDPTATTRLIHERGGKVLHDVTTLRFAHKAADAGVDGLICVASGGGGHSGPLNPFVLVPAVRAMFDGPILLAGAIAAGAAIRAALALGADLAYIGTPFIATRESRAPDAYKQMLIAAHATDLVFTDAVTGVAANWLIPSLHAHGIDPAARALPGPYRDYTHLPPTARPWRTLWSAGQSVQLITDIPPVADLVDRLATEYESHPRTQPTWQGATDE